MAYVSSIVRGRYRQNAGVKQTTPAQPTRLLTALALYQNNSHPLVHARANTHHNKQQSDSCPYRTATT